MAGDDDVYYNGFPMPSRFRESLEQLDLLDGVPHGVPAILQVVSHEDASFGQLRDSWQPHQGFEYRYRSAPLDWNAVDEAGGILLPQPVLNEIVSWMDRDGGQ